MNINHIISLFINIILIVISLCAISWVIYLCLKRQRRCWFHYIIGISSFVIIALCIKALFNNYESYDLWYKIVRTPQYCYITDIRLTKEECKDDFKEIMEIVESNYKLVARHKKIDLKKLHIEYQAKVAKVENAKEYAFLLLEYFSDLQNMHTYPFFSKFRSNISLVTRNDSVWILRCPTDVNLKKKDLILSIDSVPITTVIQKRMNITPASTDDSKRKYAALNVLSSYTDTCKHLTIQRKDSVFNVAIPLHNKLCKTKLNVPKISSTNKNSCQILPKTTRLLKEFGNIGYIDIPHFWKGSVENFIQVLDSVRECPYLILNVENNLGGTKKYVTDIAKNLINNEKRVERMTIKSEASHYKGKIYILMDELTSSGAELLVGILKGQSNVTVIGHRSGGDCDSNGYNFKTSHGIEFKLATQPAYLLPDGLTYSEGEGIMPDIKIVKLLPWEKGKNALSTAIDLICKDMKDAI